MTDTIETQTGAPAENTTRAHNKEVIFAALAELGIHRVTIDYDGADDSGQIDSIEAWDAANEKIPLPSSRKLQLTSGNPDEPLIEFNIEAAVETLAYEYLEGQHPGWEINDGAFGTFVFSVPDRTISLEHRARFTDSRHFHLPVLREAPMAHPYHHSLSSVRKWGGSPFDYLPLHSWFDLMWTGQVFFSRYSASGRVPYLLINGRELQVAPQFEFPLWVERRHSPLHLQIAESRH